LAASEAPAALGDFPPQIAGSLFLSFLCFSSALTINANKTEVEMIALNE
jgi:hypothetical protein